MNNLWHSKQCPDLDTYEKLEDKFKQVCIYLEIEHILCKIPDPTDFSVPPPYGSKFHVSDIERPGEKYIKPLLLEWLLKFSTWLNEYIISTPDYNEVTELLQKMKRACTLLISQNNSSNKLRFKEDFDFYVIFKSKVLPIPMVNLEFSPSTIEQLEVHFNLRMNFFIELKKMIKKALLSHLKPFVQTKSLFKWNSEHPELEIAEFIESLILTHRIQFSKSISPAKFYREFYLLFGIDNPMHHQKLQQIRKRINQPSYLHELGSSIERDIVKVK